MTCQHLIASRLLWNPSIMEGQWFALIGINIYLGAEYTFSLHASIRTTISGLSKYHWNNPYNTVSFKGTQKKKKKWSNGLIVMGFTDLIIHQESWTDRRIEWAVEGSVTAPWYYILWVWVTVLRDMVCEFNQQPTSGDQFWCLSLSSQRAPSNLCFSFLCLLYICCFRGFDIQARRASIWGHTTVPLDRKLIVPTHHYGLSMTLHKQAQREVMVLAGMIDWDLCCPIL